MALPQDTSEPPMPRDATDVRFSMRSLLIIMAVVAVAVTALGTFVRGFPMDERGCTLFNYRSSVR